MNSYDIVGGSGTVLHVDEVGNPCGPPILFIHGFSQSRLSWLKQMNSYLANCYRLVAMDLRGHGLSEKPRYGYDITKNWADDIQAVICTLNLYKPVLVAWSYGGLVVCDYLRIYGDNCISGIVFVAANTSIGTEAAEKILSSEFKEIIPRLLSNDAEESSEALQKIIQLVSYRPLSIEEYYFILGFMTIVPPYVRQGMLQRHVSNDDVLRKIRKPVLIIQGIEDEAVLPAVVTYIAERIPQARVSFYENVGHSPFWENPIRFNNELNYFLCDIWNCQKV